MIRAGTYIKSTSVLHGSFFEEAIVFIVESNEDGHVGFVVNKPFGKSLSELEEFRQSKSFPLLEGGPVDPEHIYVLHSRPDLIEGSRPLPNGIYVGGPIKEVIDAINSKGASQDDIKLFIGYCGWDAGELQAELDEGSWEILDELPAISWR